jgi:(p)ppGpp synthase/HD superfamily hydrolase
LSKRYSEALLFTSQVHEKQKRKGTNIPYIAHLLAVSSLVLEDGGDEDQAIAGLLHDAVEDQGGLGILEEIREKFGNEVAYIVFECSDSYTRIKLNWRKRKEDYIERLRIVNSQGVIRVSLADKLHNARSIYRDLLSDGEKIWKRFGGGRDGTIWYYQSLIQVYESKSDSLMLNELEKIVHEIMDLPNRRK